MRVLYVVLTLTLAFAAVAYAAENPARPTTTGAGQPATASPAQAMLDSCVSKCLNVTPAQIQALRAKGIGDGDIAMASAVAAKCGKPVSEVAEQFQKCRDWKTTAGVYNLSVSDLASATTMASAEIEAFNLAFCSQFYAIPSSTILRVRHQGYSWDDTNMMANAAVQCGQPIEKIVELRRAGSTWQEIAQKYNVPASAVTTPAIVRTLDVCPSPCPPVGAGPAVVCPPAVTTPLEPCPVPATVATGPMVPVYQAGLLGGPCVICDQAGNIILTLDEANQLYASGYDWLDVAVATNIRRYTGYPIRQVLIDMKGLGTWNNVLIYYGVPADVAFNVADYPFPRRSIYSASVDAANQQTIARWQRAGVYNHCPPKACVCPPPGTPVTVCPVPCPPGTTPAPATTVPGTTTPSTTTPAVVTPATP